MEGFKKYFSKLMIDIALIREKPELIISDLKKRGKEELIPLVSKIVRLDSEWRNILRREEELRHERNKVTQEIANLLRNGKDVTHIKAKAKEISEQIKNLQEKRKALKKEIHSLILWLPNITHPSVPVGMSEEDNEVIRVWGEKPAFSFKPRDHIELGLALDLFDIERAAKTSGSRFYFLKNEAVLLEFALVNFTFKILQEEGFKLIIPPVLVSRKIMEGAGFLPSGEEDVYKIKDEDLYLVGTAEVPLAGLHADEILDENRLPLYYAGFSSCFRTEAGSHGRDTKGIFRVHQFDKIEMFKYTTPETSWEEHEKLIRTAERIYRELGIPYRVVNVCSGELGFTAAKKYDIEAWLPGQNKYREIVSCSNCTDYQARRLNIRCRKKPNEKPRFVHTLNSTACAIERTIIAIIENYQQEDRSIRIPKPLVPYMDGVKEITPK